MKKLMNVAFCAACAVLAGPAYAAIMPADAPAGFVPSNFSPDSAPSGNVVQLLCGVPAEAMTTLGQTGWLMMDSQGAYWWSDRVDSEAHLINPRSATAGTYGLLGTDRSVVVQ